MYGKKNSVFIRTLALLLVLALIVPIGASAAMDDTARPYASYYLDSYGAYAYLAGNGLVQVYFNVQGTGMMDELGALNIELWESTDKTNWTWKKSFTHDSTPGMLSYNDDYHSGHVDYQGVDGRYYKAYVCVWGGKNGSGDTRYFWANVV